MSQKFKVYIDCQLFQTPVWDRGMGRYTVSLLKMLCEIDNDIGYTFIFSTHLPQESEVIKAVQAISPRSELVYLDLKSTAKSGYRIAAAQNKQVLDNYLEEQAIPEDTRVSYMIPCLFQEPTATVFPSKAEKNLIYYDAIPLLYYQRYKGVINYGNYLERHRSLFEADRIFTISQTIADDLALYYGMKIDGKRVINIDGACIDGMFDTYQKPNIALPEKYILLNTSNDIRKNNEAAVRAFDHFRNLGNREYKLVITSFFTREQKEQLKSLAGNIVFTDSVSDAELAWLYKHAEVIFTAAEYEGLGLPVLEAVRMGKKVACSNIPVFREISEEAFYYFDPLNVEDIAVTLYRATEAKGWAKKQELYKSINKKYTWERSGTLVHEALILPASTNTKLAKPKIAVLAPTPQGYSAIGKVVQELHAVTSKYFDVDYYFESRKEKNQVDIRPDFVSYLTNCYDAADFNAALYRNYDAVIYHIGNSEYHFHTIVNALHLPGIAIFHEANVREAFGEMVRLGFLLPERLEAELQLDTLNPESKAAFLTSLVNNQIAAITHSSYSHTALTAISSQGTDVARGELPVGLPAQNVQEQRRKVVHVGLAGILGGRKGLDTIKDLARNEKLAENMVLHVFGFSMIDPEAVEEIKALKNVRLSTNLSDLDYQMQLANLDVLINFRSSYRGETSLGVLEAMRYGCVAIVNRIGWFDELPDATVRKVDSPEEVIDAVQDLVESDKLRHTIGNAAKQYIGVSHDQERYVQLLHKLVTAANDSPNHRRAEAIKASNSVEQVLGLYKKIDLDLENKA